MSKGVWTSLVSEERVGTVTLFFQHCIEQSFQTDRPRMQHITEAEVKRRFEIVARIFEQLRGDLHWSLEKIFELMPQYVRDELSGVPWTPSSSDFWLPG